MRPVLLLALLGACQKSGSITFDDTGSSSAVDVDQDGWTADSDCADEDASINPGADELCDSIDNDCDAQVDEDAVDGTTVYPDQDGDGFGANTPTTVCGAVDGGVENGDDCDDTNAAINPDQPEVCDPDDVDEDCSGASDDADPGVSPDSRTSWYPDQDGDGYGASGPARVACEPGPNELTDNSDCDDTDPGANPALGCPSPWDGEYSGEVSVAVSVQWTGSDTCVGEGTLTVNGRTSPAVTGTFTCQFQSYFRYIYGTQTLTLSGDFTGADAVYGPINVGADITDDWTGSFSGSDRLSGAFDGSATVGGASVTYSGSFEVAR